MTGNRLRIGYLSTAYHTSLLLLGSTELATSLGEPPSWRLFGTGPEMVSAMAEGQLDAGYLGLPPAIIGISKGIPIRCVAGGHVEGTVVVAGRNYGSLTEHNGDLGNVLRQFEGKEIGVPSKGSIHDVILAGMLKEHHLDDKINVRNYKQAEYIAMDMERGKLAAGVGTPSLAAFASSLFDTKLIVEPDKLWPYNPSYGVFFQEAIIRDNPILVENFIIHHQNASELLRMHPIEAAERIAAVIKIVEPSYVLSTLMISPKYCVSLPMEYIDTTMLLAGLLCRLGYIDEVPNEHRIFDQKFVLKVHPRAHHYFRSSVYTQILEASGNISAKIRGS